MNAPRHVRIFRNGRSRAVRIPKDLDMFGDELVMREEDGRLILERADRPDLRAALDWIASQPPLEPEDQFPEIDDPPPGPTDDFGDELP